MSAWTVYFVLMLDGVKTSIEVATFITALTLFLFIVCFGILWMDKDGRSNLVLKYVLRAGAVLAISSAIHIATPSTKQMAAIIVLPKMANSEVAEKLGKSASIMVDLANQWMVEQVKKEEKK